MRRLCSYRSTGTCCTGPADELFAHASFEPNNTVTNTGVAEDVDVVCQLEDNGVITALSVGSALACDPEFAHIFNTVQACLCPSTHVAASGRRASELPPVQWFSSGYGGSYTWRDTMTTDQNIIQELSLIHI